MQLTDLFNQMNEQMQTPEAFEKPKEGGFESDTRFYKISKDKDGNGSVKIRFLPTLAGDKSKMMTFISRPIHAPTQYKQVGSENKKRFISEVCPKHLGKDKECPICDYAWDNYNRLIDTDDKAAKKFPATFASKNRYISNIQILEDKENPENEGKIFLFEYGEQIHKLIKKQSQPSAEEISEKGLKAFNAWDVLNGRDFRLKLKAGKFTDNGFPSWEESFFVTEASKHVADMKGLEELLEKTICLDEFLDETHINSVEKIQKSLDYVLFRDDKAKASTPAPAKEEQKSILEQAEQAPWKEEPDRVETVAEKPAETTKVSNPADASVEDFFSQFG